jgi:lysyl-tRNA synthetase class 1
MGIPPHKSVPRHPGITDVKNMNDALGDSRVQEVLTENLWRYLTVLYIDRRGLNLRNDLAHGLVSAEAFNQPIADSLFHSLLALSLMQKVKAASVSGAGPR